VILPSASLLLSFSSPKTQNSQEHPSTSRRQIRGASLVVDYGQGRGGPLRTCGVCQPQSGTTSQITSKDLTLIVKLP